MTQIRAQQIVLIPEPLPLGWEGLGPYLTKMCNKPPHRTLITFGYCIIWHLFQNEQILAYLMITRTWCSTKFRIQDIAYTWDYESEISHGCGEKANAYLETLKMIRDQPPPSRIRRSKTTVKTIRCLSHQRGLMQARHADPTPATYIMDPSICVTQLIT